MTAADDRALRRELRARDRTYAAAYDEGVRGADFDPDVWPDDPAVLDAHQAGRDERCRARRAHRLTVAASVAAWCGRKLAPRTTRRLRRARRQLRRFRAMVAS